MDQQNRPAQIEDCDSLLDMFHALAHLKGTPPAFNAIFCPIPHSFHTFVAQLEAAYQCPIPVIYSASKEL